MDLLGIFRGAAKKQRNDWKDITCADDIAASGFNGRPVVYEITSPLFKAFADREWHRPGSSTHFGYVPDGETDHLMSRVLASEGRHQTPGLVDGYLKRGYPSLRMRLATQGEIAELGDAVVSGARVEHGSDHPEFVKALGLEMDDKGRVWHPEGDVDRQLKKIKSGADIAKRGLKDKIVAYQTNSAFYANDTDWKKPGSSTYFCYVGDKSFPTPKDRGHLMKRFVATVSVAPDTHLPFRHLVKEYLRWFKASIRAREATPREIANLRDAVESGQVRIGNDPKMWRALGLEVIKLQEETKVAASSAGTPKVTPSPQSRTASAPSSAASPAP